MTKLPKSWCDTEIENILEPLETGKVIQQGWSPQCERVPSQDGEWGVLKTTAIQEGSFLPKENKKLPEHLEPRSAIEIKSGDILMTCAGPRNRCGVTCFVKETRGRLMMSGKMYRFRTDQEKVSSKYLEAFLLSQEAKYEIDKMKTGISDSGLNLTHGRFKTLSVPIAPLNEQKRIVAKIEELFSELDKGVESLKTARAQLKVYRQAVLKHAFEGQLTAQWREDNKDKLETADELLERIQKEREARYQQQLADWKILVSAWEENGKEGKKPAKPRVPKKISELENHNLSKLGSLPDSWFWGKLGQMTCGVGYGTSAKSQVSGKVPVLRMGNIQNSKFDWSDLVYTSDNVEISQYLLNLGDVLFNRTNSPELVGKTAIYQGEQPAIFAGYLIRVNQISSIVKGQYLNSFLNSHTSKQHGNAVKTDGVNQSNINGEKLSNYPFPYCSLLEQSEIVRILEEKLSIIDNTVDELKTELKKSEALRQSILKIAFSGKLVAQDPNDEPAFVLLERIKAEKNNKKKKEKAA